MLEIIKSIFIGIVQGITEWLPISSTGHMILFDEFFKLDVTPEFMSMFLVVIQLASIVAVVTLFFKKLFPWGFNKTKEETKNTFSLWFKIALACVPATVIGFLFEDKIDEIFFNPWSVAIMLILYGIAFIVIENLHKGKESKIKNTLDITYKIALLIGMFQVLALVPGTSRSGATIIGALILGVDRTTAASFTFFLAIPIMAGASLLKFLSFGFSFNGAELSILLAGMISAYIVSIIAIKFLLSYIRKNDFKVFGWYRVALGIIVIAYFLWFK